MASTWSEFEHDPRDARYADLRASDHDREVVLAAIGDAYAEGRLTREELDERTTTVTHSRLLGDLAEPLRDLVPDREAAPRLPATLADASPEELRRRAVAQWDSDRREALLGLVGPSLISLVIWLATSGIDSFPWPALVILGTALNLARVMVQRDHLVTEHERTLVRKQVKELERRDQRRREKPN